MNILHDVKFNKVAFRSESGVTENKFVVHSGLEYHFMYKLSTDSLVTLQSL